MKKIKVNGCLSQPQQHPRKKAAKFHRNNNFAALWIASVPIVISDLVTQA